MTIEKNPQLLDHLELLIHKVAEEPDFDNDRFNFHSLLQLQGQVEESWGLLSDVVEELREISPASISTLKSLTAQIFEENGQKNV